MADYKEQTIDGKYWRRSFGFTGYNTYKRQPYITFGEEDIVLADGKVIRGIDRTEVSCVLNPTQEIAMRDPATGELTGEIKTHSDLYNIMYSLYIGVAMQRDTLNLPPPAPV